MSPSKRYAKKHAKARQRRRLQVHERLERARRHAQRAAEGLHQALEDLGLPAHLGGESAGRLRSQQKLLGTMIGVRLPALCGCRPPSTGCRGRGWEKQGPSRLRGAWPKRSWRKRLRRLALEVWEPLWRQVQDHSPATQSRWQWPWGWEDAGCKQYGTHLGWVGHGWSGQPKGVLSGLDGLLLLVVIGAGRLLIPGDWALRRPAPVGPGAPCRDKRSGARVRLAACVAAFARRGGVVPAPRVGAESGWSDSQLRQDVSAQHQGPLLVEGKPSSPLSWAKGPKGKGGDLIHGAGGPWRQAPWEPGVSYVRLRATSPT
jgi:hypothetical protein